MSSVETLAKLREKYDPTIHICLRDAGCGNNGIRFTLSGNEEWIKLAREATPDGRAWLWNMDMSNADVSVVVSFTYLSFLNFLKALPIFIKCDDNFELFFNWVGKALINASTNKFINYELATKFCSLPNLPLTISEQKKDLELNREYVLLVYGNHKPEAVFPEVVNTVQSYIAAHPEKFEILLHNWLKSPMDNKEEKINE